MVTNTGLHRRIMFGALLPGLALGAIGRRRKQKDLKEVLQDSFVFGIGNLIPVVGQALWFSSITGWGNKSNFAGLHGQFIQGMTDVVSDIIGNRVSYKTLPSMIRTIEQLSGIPDWPLKVTERLFRETYIDGGSLSGKTLMESLTGPQME